MQDIRTLINQPPEGRAEIVSDGRQSKPPTVEEMKRAAFSKGNLTPSHFARLWQRMAETFGHQWTSNFGTEPLPGWIDGLADMTVDDIKTGLGNLKTWQAEGGWPPNMLQFRELCRPHSAPAHTAYVPLPQPKSPWDVRQHAASTAFAELREGILKPEIAARDYRLSEEDRARLEKLDWERIQLAADGDFEGLSATPQPEPLETLEPESSTSCTCKLKQVSANNWGRTGKPCAYCVAWDKKLRDAGSGNGPRPTESGKGKRRYKRAA